MRIGIDARLIKVKRGIGNALHALLTGIAQSPTNHKFVLYVDDDSSAQMLPSDSRFAVKTLRPSLYPAWEQLALPRAVSRDRLDILHCPANTAPIRSLGPCKLVVTIHDVIFFSADRARASLWHEAQFAYYRLVVPRVARAADALITVSEFSRRDIAATLNISPSKIRVVYNALDRPSPPAPLGNPMLSEPYVVALGAPDPRKNTAAVLQAFAEYKAQKPGQMKLAVVGLQGAFAERMMEVATGLGIAQDVRSFGFVSDAELQSLYSAACALIYPSLYEGFGLPVLEAMRYGTPVIASQTTSIPEVAGGAAVLIDPQDPHDIARAIERVEADSALRAELDVLGRRRAEYFSIERMANDTLAVYGGLGEAERDGT